MKILVEGPDCSGKTTLAKSLSELTKSNYFHFEYEPDNEVYKKQVETTLQYISSQPNVLIDRFIPSELIYGEVCRNENRLLEIETTNWPDLFDLIIFTIPSDKERYLQHFKDISEKREEYVKDIKQISKIYDRYVSMYMDMASKYKNVINYDLYKVI